MKQELLRNFLIDLAMSEFDSRVSDSLSTARTHENPEIATKYPLFVHNLGKPAREHFLVFATHEVDQILRTLSDAGRTPSIDKLEVGFIYAARAWVSSWWMMSIALNLSSETINGSTD